MNNEKARILDQVCKIAFVDREAAADLLKSEYPFIPSRPTRRSFSKNESIEIFTRDRFVDRYSGELLVNPGVLRIFSELFPDEFPFHPHGKLDESHIAYWELMPTVDHIIPLAQGGKHEPSNWATTSMISNLAKRNSTLTQVGWELLEVDPSLQWDGLSHWFVEAVAARPQLLDVPLIRGWFSPTKEAFDG